MSENFITKKGLAKLKEELNELIKVKRPEVSARIKEAVSFGDLSENAEYAEAKEDQAFIEGRIAEIENVLRNVDLVSFRPRTNFSVQIGCAVVIKSAGQNRTFKLMGKGEGNPSEGEISSDSPIGRAIMGRSIGEEVDVPAPSGKKRYKIIKIKA